MSDKKKLKKSRLFPDEFTKEIDEDFSLYVEETERLEKSEKKRKAKNEKFMANLPKGLTFMVGNFEITI